MCQVYEAEKEYVVRGELAEIRRKWEKHQSGEEPLTDDEIQELAVRKFMLEEN